jgi:hypothetical protein
MDCCLLSHQTGFLLNLQERAFDVKINWVSWPKPYRYLLRVSSLAKVHHNLPRWRRWRWIMFRSTLDTNPSSVNSLHRHFVKNDMLNHFMSLTPRPPSSFGLNTSFQLTQATLFLSP